MPRAAGGCRDGDVDHVGYYVNLGHGVAGGFDHLAVELIAGLMQTRGVEKNDLTVRFIENPQYPVASGLGLGRDDGYLLAEQAVEQGGLTGVGGAYQGDQAADGFLLPIAAHDQFSFVGGPTRRLWR